MTPPRRHGSRVRRTRTRQLAGWATGATGSPWRMSVTDVLLAPVRIPVRVVRALDDLATLAHRARRDPDPVEEVRERLDTLLLELAAVVGVAQEIVRGGAELTDVARATVAAAIHLDTTGRTIHEGGQDLLAATRQMDADTRELIAGGERLTEVTEQL